MSREQLATYTGFKVERTRENEQKYLWGSHEYVKRAPKYVHGRIGHASLLHKVQYVSMRWYDYDYDYLYRLQNPILSVRTNCGMFWRLASDKAHTCEMPKPDAVLCAACHGEGKNFPRGKEHKIPMRLAKVRLGCIATAEDR